ncbi:hypothetical protein ACI8AV_13130 [Geodermatophilus sp. SYSU D00804]
MSVIINELEVTAREETPPQPPPGSPARPPLPAGQTPFELRALLRHVADRAERVWAD